MKKARLLFGLLLVSLCASGCDALDNLFPGKKEDEKQQKEDDKKKPEVQSISVTNDHVDLEVSHYYQITHEILPSDANQNVTYKSFDEDTAVVYNDGKIYGISAGEVTIRVISAEKANVYTDVYVTVFDNTPIVTEYSVTYNANGGTGSMVDSLSPYEEGSTVIVKPNAFSRNGYDFVNFNTKADGSGISYSEGNTFTINSDVTLYAQWQKQSSVTTYTVTYSANGGTGSMVDAASPYAESSTVTVKSNAFSRVGYDFVNFNTAAGGTGTSYAPGDTFTINSNVTLYAQWSKQSGGTGYYDSITATSGIDLLGQLHDLSVDKHTLYTNYSSGSNCIDATMVAKTDPYPNSSYAMDFYSGAPARNGSTSGGDGSAGWNREHVWCQSLSNGLFGKSGAGSDIQHIRPTIPALNSHRGSLLYGELNNSGTLCTSTDVNGNTVTGGYKNTSTDTFQPLDNKKGDCARIIMYVYMHYNTYSNVGGTKDGSVSSYFGTLPLTNIMKANSESAAKQLLVTWCNSDPVDSIEMTRNEEAAKITGCRNPFIDHPEYASDIWG